MTDHCDCVLPVPIPDDVVLQDVQLAHVLVVLVHVDEEEGVANHFARLQRDSPLKNHDLGQRNSLFGTICLQVNKETREIKKLVRFSITIMKYRFLKLQW